MSTNLSNKAQAELVHLIHQDNEAATTIPKIRDLVVEQTKDLSIGTERQRWNLGRLVIAMRAKDNKTSDQAVADALQAKGVTVARSTVQQARSYVSKVLAECGEDTSEAALAAAMSKVLKADRASNAQAAARSKAKAKDSSKGTSTSTSEPKAPEGRRIVTPQALEVADALLALLEALEGYSFEDDPTVTEALAAAHAALDSVTDSLDNAA